MAKNVRWTVAEAVRVGNALVTAGRRYQARLVDRGINATFLNDVDAAVLAANAAAAGQPVRLGAQTGTTAALGDALTRAQSVSGAARRAITRVLPRRKDVQKSFGVGAKDDGLTVRDALAAIDSVLQGWTEYPTEAAAAGILQRDVDRLNEIRNEVLGKDTTQEGAKGDRKGGTAAKDDTLRDLIRRLDAIIAAADLEFVDEPNILAEFRGALPSKKKKGAGGNAGGGASAA
jgi:hypothetical protein